jgi:hypothetical protein
MSSYQINAHHIVPNLWLGSRHTITGHQDFLEDNKIDVVISALTEDEYDDYMISSPDFIGREWHRLVIDDDPYELIMSNFDFVHLVIRKALRDNKRILVHCAAGVSRSATLVAAYLILENNMTAQEAINFIISKRECVNPNDGFRWQLKELEERCRRIQKNINENNNISGVDESKNINYGTSDDDLFTPLPVKEADDIKEKIADPLLNESIKDIFECHGDPSGNLLYIGGMSADNMYCIYIKKTSASTNEKQFTSRIIKYNNINEYIEYLVTIDGELFNR